MPKRLLTLYRIAENFRGRKLSRISRFCGYTRKFSPWNLGRGVLWRCKSEQSAKVFSAKIVFSPICKNFFPRKFPAIQYVSCMVDSGAFHMTVYYSINCFTCMGWGGEGREEISPPSFSLYEISAVKELLMNQPMCALSSAVPLTMPHCVFLHGSVWSVSVGRCMDRWRGTPQKSVLHVFHSHTSSLGMRLYSSSNYILSFILGSYNQNHGL